MQIDVRGRFFKYRSGTGLIRVRASRGGYVDLMPGQCINNLDFDSLAVSDLSMARNEGVIIAGDFDFRDERIAGTVEIQNSASSLVRTNSAYSGFVECTSIQNVTGTSKLQLWTGRNADFDIFVESMIVTSSEPGKINWAFDTFEINDVYSGSVSSKSGNGGEGMYVKSSYDKRTLPKAAGGIVVEKNRSVIIDFKTPYMLRPSNGFTVSSELGGTLSATFEFYKVKK